MGDDEQRRAELVAQVIQRHRDAFRAKLPERRGELEGAWRAAMASDFTGEALDALFRQVHSLEGKGGTLGLPQVSITAAPLKVALRARVEGEPSLDVEAMTTLYDRLQEAMGRGGAEPTLGPD